MWNPWNCPTSLADLRLTFLTLVTTRLCSYRIMHCGHRIMCFKINTYTIHAGRWFEIYIRKKINSLNEKKKINSLRKWCHFCISLQLDTRCHLRRFHPTLCRSEKRGWLKHTRPPVTQLLYLIQTHEGGDGDPEARILHHASSNTVQKKSKVWNVSVVRYIERSPYMSLTPCLPFWLGGKKKQCTKETHNSNL